MKAVYELTPSIVRKGWGMQEVMLCLLAVVAYVIYSMAWPLAPGRDYASYLTYYIQLRDGVVALPEVMSHRAPLVPLLIGVVGGMLGPFALEVIFGAMYVCIALIVYLIGKRFSPAAGWLSTLALLAYPTYGWFAHQVNSDFPFSFGFLCWAFAIIRTAERPTLFAFALHGFLVFLLTLVRPSSSLLFLFALFPFLLHGLTWKQKTIRAILFLTIGLLLLLIYSGWSTARFGGAGSGNNAKAFIPLYRFYVGHKIIRPENGPLSKEMADAVSRHLLSNPPYISSAVDAETFFTHGSARMLMDMKWLVKEKKVANGDYAIMRGMALEAFWKNPFMVLKSGLYDLCAIFLSNHQIPENTQSATTVHLQTSEERISWMKQRLFEKSSSEPIPIALSEYRMYLDDAFLKNYRVLHDNINNLQIRIPERDGHETLARLVRQFNKGYPFMFWWITAGLVGALFVRHHLGFTLLFIIILSFLSVSVPVIAINNLYFYRMPFDPIFISLGAIGFARYGLRLRSNQDQI